MSWTGSEWLIPMGLQRKAKPKYSNRLFYKWTSLNLKATVLYLSVLDQNKSKI